MTIDNSLSLDPNQCHYPVFTYLIQYPLINYLTFYKGLLEEKSFFEVISEETVKVKSFWKYDEKLKKSEKIFEEKEIKIFDIFRKPTVLQAKTVGSYEFKYYQYDPAQNIAEYLFRHAFENELTNLEAMSQNSMLALQPNLEKYKKEDQYWDLSTKRENICQNISEKFKSKDKVICKQIIDTFKEHFDIYQSEINNILEDIRRGVETANEKLDEQGDIYVPNCCFGLSFKS